MADRDYDAYVVPGQVQNSSFTWTNGGLLGFAPKFRLEIQSGESGWVQGAWVDSPMVDPGGTSPEITVSVKVPPEWRYGETVALNIEAKLEGVFSETNVHEFGDVLEIPKISPSDIEIIRPVLFQEE